MVRIRNAETKEVIISESQMISHIDHEEGRDIEKEDRRFLIQ